MSQMLTRKRTGGDEKEKRTESPVKDMKKKMAANAEKEKNAAEANSKLEKPTDKPVAKPADKPTDKPAEKPANKTADKSADKTADKPANKAADKPADKPQKADKAPEKAAEKKQDKPAEKKDGQSEKKREENGKGESSGKPDPQKTSKADARPKQNGSNGVNGTVSPGPGPDSESDETELFPELAYDDSDVEWEPGMDRALTRRSQVKATRTPETPRPASDKQETGDESKESKVLKLNQDSAKAGDTPKPEARKTEAKPDAKKPETPSKQDVQGAPKDAKKEAKESPKKAEDKKGEKSDKVEVEVVVEIESTSEPSEESRKPDTNFSKSRVKVSPYRRSVRLADQTTSSIAANYTGNNTTMEMDITESSSFLEESLDDSYLSGLRSIRGRRSYKLLKDMPPRAALNRSAHSTAATTTVSEQASRPTAPVVGRKRKPEPEDNISIASEAAELPTAGKRQRLLERLARPFRRATLMPARRNAEIVGINTDLPLTAPVASTSHFDPETLKASPSPAPLAPSPPAPAETTGEDPKRCVVM